jgi:hypothetical protein
MGIVVDNEETQAVKIEPDQCRACWDGFDGRPPICGG